MNTNARWDFDGWATRNDIKCSDGRTIRRDAFKDNDGTEVPLVWNHLHNDISNVLGHVLLENRKEGVYAYGFLNDSEEANKARVRLKNGDIKAMSIYANQLKQNGGDVLHGTIREVSLVLAGANKGANIENVSLRHGDGSETVLDEEIIYYWNDGESIQHAAPEEDKKEAKKEDTEVAEEKKSGKTVKEVFDSLTDEQKTVVYFLVGQAAKGGTAGESAKQEDDEEMKHNVFDNDSDRNDTLTHDAMNAIIGDAKKYGSMKESFLAHAEEYGIDGLEWLFPEDRNVNGNTPEWIKRDMDWVDDVMKGVHHTPFSRVKSTFANITEDEARAKGYIKGNMKKEEVFSLLKRSTSPQTIYKKQKIDRDDQIDIADFDVVSWLKGEMRMMLDEEIARAVLIGDGRLASDDDKISEEHIRPIANDADLFTVKRAVTVVANDPDATAKNFIRTAIKARKDYKGSGNPVLFTNEDLISDMLLLEDGIGHALYETESALATKLRVRKIVSVPVMENVTVGGKKLMGIIVNMNDYNIGADKGGAVNMFDDFDIDYNQMKYLIETRCSGALVKPYSAIVLFETETPTSVDGGVKKSKTEYLAVEPEVGDNPKQEGWYEVNDAGKYVPTTDTTVTDGKTYYKRIDHRWDR